MSLNSLSNCTAAVFAILKFCPVVVTMQLAPVSQNVTFLFVVSCLYSKLAAAGFNKQ